jgi:hypothetical protein
MLSEANVRRSAVRKARIIAAATGSVLAASAFAASPAAAATSTCGLISQAALAKAIGLPHIATESNSVPIEPGGVWGECEIRAWSGSKPGGSKLSKCHENSELLLALMDPLCVFAYERVFTKQQTARLVEGTLAYALINIVTQDAGSPLAQNWKLGYYGTSPFFQIQGGPKDQHAKPPTLGAEVAEGKQGGGRVRHAQGKWLSFAKLLGIRLAVFASAKKKPVLLLNKIAAIAVPAFGL